MIDLSRFPRRHYYSQPTPIEKLDKLTARLGGPDIYIKRDDQLGLTGGGNKTRKLEFVVGDALAKGADALITCGGLQSNHCRLTASAAAREKLDCHLVLIEEEFQTYNKNAGGNNLLFHLLQVKGYTVISKEDDFEEAMRQVGRDLEKQRKTPYIVTMGASYPVGTLGYMSCAEEIITQSQDLDIHFDHVICPLGSGGTLAGLVIGFEMMQSDTHVLGMNVARQNEEQVPVLTDLIQQSISELELDCRVAPSRITCFDGYVGPGYTIPTPEMINAVKLLAAEEGILLDPIYTGKAMAGLLDLIQKGYFYRDARILFLHTGGSPALYMHPELFID